MISSGAVLTNKAYPVARNTDNNEQKVTFGIISDLHHLQFGQKEELRIQAFMDDVIKRSPSFIIQNGDFCRPVNSGEIMNHLTRQISKQPRLAILRKS